MTSTDPRADAYIDALPEWQQAICREVRALVHAAGADVAETIKRTKQPISGNRSRQVDAVTQARSGVRSELAASRATSLPETRSL